MILSLYSNDALLLCVRLTAEIFRSSSLHSFPYNWRTKKNVRIFNDAIWYEYDVRTMQTDTISHAIWRSNGLDDPKKNIATRLPLPFLFTFRFHDAARANDTKSINLCVQRCSVVSRSLIVLFVIPIPTNPLLWDAKWCWCVAHNVLHAFPHRRVSAIISHFTRFSFTFCAWQVWLCRRWSWSRNTLAKVSVMMVLISVAVHEYSH